MAHLLLPDARVGASNSRLPRGRRTTVRVRMILETRPGTLPWKPDFGVDLSRLVGSPLTQTNIEAVKTEISSAMETWAPDIEVLSLEVQAVTDLGAAAGARDRTIPLAEGALVRLGTQASLQVEMALRTEEGDLNLSAKFRGEDAAGALS